MMQPWMMLAQTAPAPGSLQGHFTWIDWLIVIGYFVFTTILGGALAGKQATIRDFFLGGRKLPWYAVAGSIVATEISAVTFVVGPFIVFAGDFTYLQLGVFGALLSRLIVGYVLVPAYYKREIYSPYDYMGNQLGSGVRKMTTALFTLGGILAQSSRVYLTAVVLQLVLKGPLDSMSEVLGLRPLAIAIWIIGIIAVAWTIMGGITTVIWTDVILFLVFLSGAVIAIITVAAHVDGGFGAIYREGLAAGKFHFWDFSPDPTRAYTVWTAIIANTWFSTAIYGTDQLMAQRIFCCKGPREARKAVLASYAGQLVTLVVMLVGVGLFVYYRHHPLEGEALQAFDQQPNRIFPIFILTVIPAGLTGLIIAGVFAAAISSLDSILAALSQTTISAFYLPLRKSGDPDSPAEARRTVIISRGLIVFWGIALCLMAQLMEPAARRYASILDLALAMAGYSAGALLAGFLLAFLPLKINGRGFLWSAPLSVLTVFAMVWHDPWAQGVCWTGAAVLFCSWALYVLDHPEAAVQTFWLMLGIAIMILIGEYGYFMVEDDGQAARVSVAWPWQAPLGTVVAFVWGYLLAGKRVRE